MERKQHHQQFIDDMESEGIEWREYRGRNFYEGPAVATDDIDFIQSITSLRLQVDQLGRSYIVYPRN